MSTGKLKLLLNARWVSLGGKFLMGRLNVRVLRLYFVFLSINAIYFSSVGRLLIGCINAAPKVMYFKFLGKLSMLQLKLAPNIR